MRKTFLLLLLLFALCGADPKKLSKSRSSSSSRSSNKKTNYNPQPTSISHSAPASAPKPSLFGWQEKPAQRKQAPPPRQSPQPKQTQTHSYPSSNTGLSGSASGPAKQPTHQQESVQKSAASQQSASVPQSNSQSGHSYPSSNGLSGNSGSAGYPQQQSGLSGTGSGYPQGQANRPVSGAGYPQQQGGLSGSAGAAPPPYSSGGGNYHSQGSAYSNSGNYPKQPPPYSPGNNYHQPPPPYSQNYGGHGSYGGHGYNPVHTPQMPGYFGNYGNNGRSGFGGVGRSSNILTGVGIAGAGVGTILTGLALWNLARSTGHHRHTVIYDNRGQPVAVAPDNGTEPAVDPILGDLVNCTLTISTDNATEVLGIPCAIATSFTPDADIKEENAKNNPNDNTKCTVTVVNKAGREFMTTIPCSTLLNTAAENNVTEPTILKNDSDIINSTINVVPPDSQTINPIQPTALPLADSKLNCSLEPGTERDPINPCYAIVTNLTVIPLDPNLVTTSATPASA